MATVALSTKRILIDKANTRVVTYVSVAAFVLVFSLVSTKTLIGQAAYQNKIISGKRTAVNQLKSDITATGELKTAYDAFTGTAQNVIGGNSDSAGPKDGSNAKIVLDALPSSYDFPGLTSSLESLLGSQGVTIQSIAGTDDQVNQGANQSSATPQPVPIPFTFSVEGGYANMQAVIGSLEKSIRPMQIQTIDISGNNGNMKMDVGAQTFYQPAKSLNINQKVVK